MYIISQEISEDLDALWFEGVAYMKKNLYSILPDRLPPIHYDSHTLNPHSLTHIETPKHTQINGKSIDWYFDNAQEHFYGECLVCKLSGDFYQEKAEGVYHWEVSLNQLKIALDGKRPKKLLLTSEGYPMNRHGFHDPNYILTLSMEAASFLVGIDGFNLYGTTWKSSDYSPGSSDRPVHNKLFEKALIIECLKLDHVPAGKYELSAFPLNIKGASESPVTATLKSILPS
jgi:arylformamidase